MKKLFFLLCLLCISFAAAAQSFVMNANCKTAYDLILQGRMKKASILLSYERKTNPENLCPVLLDNYVDFASFLITGDQIHAASMEKCRSKRISELGILPDDNPFKRWAVAVINLQAAFVKVKTGQQYAAALDVRRSLLLLEKNQKRFPDFRYDELPLGILHATVGTIPPEYGWIMKLVSVNGSIAQGREELHHFLTSSTSLPEMQFMRMEALYFLSFLETSFSDSKNDRAWALNQYRASDMNYGILVESKTMLEMKLGFADQAIATIDSFKQTDCLPCYRLAYWKSESLLRKGDLTAANGYRFFLKMSKNDDYKADAMRKLAWIACLQGDEKEYYRLISRVSELTCAVNETDCEAIREAQSGSMPNKHLLMARLSFDGSFFEKALQSLELASADSLTEKQSLEIVYRKGRVFQEMVLDDKAIQCYCETVSSGETSPYYFAANAALKLGEIYLSRGDSAKAKTYLRKCLAMEPDEYKNGIHQKANAILNQLD